MPPKTRIEKKGQVAHLILDDPEESLNTLGAAMVAELAGQVAALKADGSVQAVVLRSGKRAGFVAGADLKELRALSDAADAAGEGYRAAKAGQALMDAIEDLGKPVVAAIHGHALGGGCELALACTARVAASEGVRIGLPEVQFGILPGFGGTWRLPRLITYAAAAAAIVNSTLFDTRRALSVGLVDESAPFEELAGLAEALALKLRAAAAVAALEKKRRKLHPRMRRILEWGILKNGALDRARSQVLAKNRDRYPAPLRMIELMRIQLVERDPYMDREARTVGELLATDVSRNLVRLFFLGQEAKRRSEGSPSAVARTCVVGAGALGTGIAIALASKAKLPVALKDSDGETLVRALAEVEAHFRKAVARRILSQADAAALAGLVSPADDAAVKAADLVVEAVGESLDLKRAVFAELERLTPESAVLASGGGYQRIADISAEARHPERILGMHFFRPAESTTLVEIVAGPRTSPAALARAQALALALGKTPVLVKDSPGFLVNRVLVPYLLEAAQLVAEGVPPGKVEAAAADFGMPLGPLTQIGEMGMAVVAPMVAALKAAFPGRLPSPAWLERPDSGQAFGRDKEGNLRVRHDSIGAWVGIGDPKRPLADLQDRLYVAMLNEAARALDEGLVSGPGVLDLALVHGMGFPAHKGGPLRLAEARGAAAWAARAETLAEKAPWLKPPASLASRAGFY